MKILILYVVLLIFGVYSENTENLVTSSTETVTNVTIDEIETTEDANYTEIETLNTSTTEKTERLNPDFDPYDLIFNGKDILKSSKVDDVLASSAFLKGWNIFKEVNHKKYKNKKIEKVHKKIFLNNIIAIDDHNKKYEAGLVTYKLGINQYADMLHGEFVKKMTGMKISVKEFLEQFKRLKETNFTISTFVPPQSTDIPNTFDWRDQGAVTYVKNQGYCGSCWAFSATGAIEGQIFRKSGKLIALSEQHLVDCAYKYYGILGCQGGYMISSFKFIKDNGGISSEYFYPYKAKSITGMMQITPSNEEHLKIAVATAGPVSVAIDASSLSFQFYTSGVYYDRTCSSDSMNHAVLVVGYGTDPVGGDYWLVKNSWGVDWGNKGYIKMARNRNDLCGITQAAGYPIM